MQHTFTRSAYEFFRENGASWVGHNAQNAASLARAERYAQDSELRFVWEYDDLPLSDIWEDHDTSCTTYLEHRWQYDCAAQHCRHDVCSHDVLFCAMLPACQQDHAHISCDVRTPGETILESLGGIIDPTRQYRRVIEAEFASEYLANIKHAWSQSDRVTSPLHAS